MNKKKWSKICAIGGIVFLFGATIIPMGIIFFDIWKTRNSEPTFPPDWVWEELKEGNSVYWEPPEAARSRQLIYLASNMTLVNGSIAIILIGIGLKLDKNNPPLKETGKQ